MNLRELRQQIAAAEANDFLDEEMNLVFVDDSGTEYNLDSVLFLPDVIYVAETLDDIRFALDFFDEDVDSPDDDDEEETGTDAPTTEDIQRLDTACGIKGGVCMIPEHRAVNSEQFEEL